MISKPTISAFIAASMDGFIAKKDGNLDWLTSFPTPTNREEAKDCGYSEFIADIDVLIMGRNTYEVVAKFKPWPYDGIRVIVLSSTLTSASPQAELFNGDIQELILKLSKEGIRHIYVDGGTTISQFINAGLVDELIISIIPVMLSAGIPLFSNLKGEKWWELADTKFYSNGLAQLRYVVK